MSESVSKVLLWLFVINLGIAFGAGLYEGRISRFRTPLERRGGAAR